MGGMLFDFKTLGRTLKRAAPVDLWSNPAGVKTPEEYEDILDQISQWSRVGQKKHAQLVAGNAKMNKQVSYSPISSNAKLAKAGKSIPWITQGVALMPAATLGRYFRMGQKPGAPYNRELLKKFSITEEDIKRFDHACPGATSGCMAVCLADAGMMGQDQITIAQVKRHLVYHMDRDAFMATLAVGIAKVYQRAQRRGANLGIRLNVTSDIPFEKQPMKVDRWLAQYLSDYGIRGKNGKAIRPGSYKNIMTLMPGVFFYDYTKIVARMDLFLRGRLPKNYHLVWSLAETPINRKMAIRVLRSKKTTVSVPFYVGPKRNPLPRTLTIVDNTRDPEHWVKRPVFDADEHDMRALDAPGTFAGLKFKIPGKEGAVKLKTPVKVARAKGFVLPIPRGERHPVIFVRGGPG